MSILLALFLSFLTTNPTHAIYIGVIEIVCEANESTLSLKVFSDDLRDSIRNYDDAYTPGDMNTFHIANEALIADYFSEKIQLEINGQTSALKLLRIEKESEVHRIYFEVAAASNLKEVSVTSDFFTELFPTQNNIVHLTINGKKYFGKLTKSSPTFSVTLD